LRVTPASELPLVTLEHSGKMVIVNLQATEKDSQATLKVNSYCDDIMRAVMDKLNITVPLYDPLNDFVINKELNLIHTKSKIKQIDQKEEHLQNQQINLEVKEEKVISRKRKSSSVADDKDTPTTSHPKKIKT